MTEPATLSGVETLVRLLLLRERLDAAGGRKTATFVSGYPGSPLAGFDLALDRLGGVLGEHRIVHRPGLNEELAVAAVWGSQMGAVVPYDGLDGVAGAWYGKAPGLDRSGDALKHANAMGAGPGGGAVLFCGDDPAAKSSTLACDSQYTFADACVPVLYPGDQQDLLDLGVHAFRLSRYAGTWAGLKIVTAVADGVGTVDLDPARHRPRDPEGTWRHVPQTTVGPHAVPDQEALIAEHRLRAAQAYAVANGLDRVSGADEGAPLGVVCAGKTYLDVLQAFADLGVAPEDLGVRLLRLGMTFPLAEETVLAFAGTVDRIAVVEEKRPFVEAQLRAILHEAGSPVPVDGRRRLGVPAAGELDPGSVGKALGTLLPELRRGAPASRRSLPLIPARAPGYCSGCPHNRSTVVPEGALTGGGVGCHGIMYFEARNAGLRSLPPTPMGAEGVPWLGLAPFVADPHVFQNLGDGTLSHSGTLAIRAAVAAGADMTFKILYNAAVAMTGGQDVTGVMDVPALTRALEAEGVARTVVCAEDPGHYGRRARWAAGVRVLGRDRLAEVQQELRGVPGVTVIVYDQRCAAEARRLRRRGELPTPPRQVFIDPGVCEGCGDCSAKSNCLSVLPLDTELGVKRRIHDPSCNRDYTCLEGDCPSFVTVTPVRRGRRKAVAPARPAPPAGALPAPSLPGAGERYGVYFTGIGGTGVVTASRILAGAAEAAGFDVSGLDQTGLSQKAGAVVSHLVFTRGAGGGSVGDGGADLYLSGDILQAAAERHLAKLRPGTSLAVVDPVVTPTAAMLQTSAAPPGEEELRAAVTDRAARAAFVDAKGIAEAVFADHLLANVVLLGAAFQLGGLPIPESALAGALAGHGGTNAEAFTWGRWAAHDPAAVAAVLGGPADPDGPTPRALAAAGELVPEGLPLRDLVLRRAAHVIDYQNVRLAGRYVALVGKAAARDDAAHGHELTRAVAEAWFRLITYKDEYEVARLHLRTGHAAVARALGVTGPYKVTYNLHPPALRRFGLRRKLRLGRSAELGFRLLARLKWLRGTPFDVPGWDRDRRIERALIGEYERLLESSLAADPPYERLVEIAASAMSIKGYFPVKEAAVVAWREWAAGVLEPAG